LALNTDDSIPTRESLLSRLKNWDDQESWRDFFDTYWQLIHRVARKAGLHEDEAQDVVQDTILSVAKKMPAFKYDRAVGSFRGWLFQLTRWRIINQFKKRQPRSVLNEPLSIDPSSSRPEEVPSISDFGFRISDFEVSLLTSAATVSEEIPDPAGSAVEALWEEEWQQHLLATAIARVKCQVSPSQYQMFDLYVNKRMSVGDVARALGVNAAQIYLAKHRVGVLLKKEVRKLENAAV